MVLLLGHSEDGRGQWEWEGSSAGLWNECVPEKTTCGAKAVCLCMIQPFIISVFQNLGSGCFFRSPAFFSESGGKFCRIEVRHFFPPKGGSRYVVHCICTTSVSSPSNCWCLLLAPVSPQSPCRHMTHVHGGRFSMRQNQLGRPSNVFFRFGIAIRPNGRSNGVFAQVFSFFPASLGHNRLCALHPPNPVQDEQEFPTVSSMVP